MKTILFAAALSISSIALAQTATDTTQPDPAATTQQPSGETVDDPSQATGPRGITQQGTNPDGMHCTPAGFNTMGGSPYPQCVDGRHPNIGRDPQSPPPCTRNVKDHCIQSYERGVRR